MKYLLSTLNTTKERSRSIKDYIQLAFMLEPRDLRYNTEFPTLVKSMAVSNADDQDVLIQERINKLVDEIRSRFSSNVSLISIVKSGVNERVVTLEVEEELLKLKL